MPTGSAAFAIALAASVRARRYPLSHAEIENNLLTRQGPAMAHSLGEGVLEADAYRPRCTALHDIDLWIRLARGNRGETPDLPDWREWDVAPETSASAAA